MLEGSSDQKKRRDNDSVVERRQTAVMFCKVTPNQTPSPLIEAPCDISDLNFELGRD